MSRRRKYTDELKLEMVQEYLSGKYSFKFIAEKYHVVKGDLQKWVAAYKEHGINGIAPVHGTYSVNNIRKCHPKIELIIGRKCHPLN